MCPEHNALFGLNADEQSALHDDLLHCLPGAANDDRAARRATGIPPRFASFADLPKYKELQVHIVIADKMGILNPFFTSHEGMARNTTRIDGRDFLNFSTYDYLGLNGHPDVLAAAHEAMNRYGTSAGASRLVAGERPPHGALEKGLAALYGTEDCVTFVSGHATNVSTLSTIMGPHDVVYHDALAHNSLILGAVLSGAARHAYPHNDMAALERLLRQTRGKYERAVIVTEGLFSMDGSIARLPELLELKRDYTCFLMVDEAHALGILGATGRGVSEHYGLDPAQVDIWMGTLSKTLCGCGGYIAGCAELVTLLKFRAAGFVYSVGMSPPLAAASLTALHIMLREPERTARLQHLSAFFLQEAKKRGLNTGYAEGFAVIPIIVGNSLVAGHIAAVCFKNGINALPIMYPVVEEGQARLRFFLSTWHEEDDIVSTLDFLATELPKAQQKFH